MEELQQALESKGNLKLLFNTSGVDYRQLGMKDKLPTLPESEALGLLTQNGNLVKRPFVTESGISLIGFKENEWKSTFA